MHVTNNLKLTMPVTVYSIYFGVFICSLAPFHLLFAASCWSINWKTRTVCELSEAELWGKDLHLDSALHSRVSDLPHRG